MAELEFELCDNKLIHRGYFFGHSIRELTAYDWSMLASWVQSYHDLAWLSQNEAELLGLGRQIYDWLTWDSRWLTYPQKVSLGPEFCVPAQLDEQARLFLAVPWELAATSEGHLAADGGLGWAPVRRIGHRQKFSLPNDKHRLGILFMAASPDDAPMPDIEAEEFALQQGLGSANLDLLVADSGNIDDLSLLWRELGSLDSVHLSCHGFGGAKPALIMERPYGVIDKVGLERLDAAFSGFRPRLLSVSACHGAASRGAFNSLATSLIGAGFPAVFAWSDAINDREATVFAATFYEELSSRGRSLTLAWQIACSRVHTPAGGAKLPEHWHLARLFIGPDAGGLVATGSLSRFPAPDLGRRSIVAARPEGTDVASRFEFVGRRRELQEIHDAFRRDDYGGVLIHGYAGQGKSSLAARVIDRHPHLIPVVLFRCCDGPTVLAAICEKIGASWFSVQYHKYVDPNQPSYKPSALYDIFRILLTLCANSGKPILLVLDAVDALLDAPVGSARWQITSDVLPTLSAVVRAFDSHFGSSRLLMTSRYLFRFENNDGKYHHLYPIHLSEAPPRDRLKQARQKIVAWNREWPEKVPSIVQRVIDAARGNAGLQNLLFEKVKSSDTETFALIDDVERFYRDGTLPDDPAICNILDHGNLLSLLNKPEKFLLHASTLFKEPLPLDVWYAYIKDWKRAHEYTQRLFEFGLWEVRPNYTGWRRLANAPNAIIAARIHISVGAEEAKFIGKILPILFDAWDGPDRSRISAATDVELTRLALICGDLKVLSHTALFAIREHEVKFDYRAASATARATLGAFAAESCIPPVHLLRAASEAFRHVSDPDGLQQAFAFANSLPDDPSLPWEERLARAQFHERRAEYLEFLGDLDGALATHQQQLPIFDALGDPQSRSLISTEIAGIMERKGDLQGALAIYEQSIKVLEPRGARRDLAVILGRIAGIKARCGDAPGSLALRRKQLQIFDALADRGGRATTLGAIARDSATKGDWQTALALQKERLEIFEELGDQRGRALALGDLAEIKLHSGDVEGALKLYEEELQFHDLVGDTHSWAVTAGEIAEIRVQLGDIDSGLALRERQLQIFDRLGDRKSWAIALGGVARGLEAKGDWKTALAYHRKRLKIFEELNEQRGRGLTLVSGISVLAPSAKNSAVAPNADLLATAIEPPSPTQPRRWPHAAGRQLLIQQLTLRMHAQTRSSSVVTVR